MIIAHFESRAAQAADLGAWTVKERARALDEAIAEPHAP